LLPCQVRGEGNDYTQRHVIANALCVDAANVCLDGIKGGAAVATKSKRKGRRGRRRRGGGDKKEKASAGAYDDDL
jgi:hypothetical protein